ncbi:MAG: hypothetical protein IH912_11445 [Proteobacteria bacterium]|nr:hypothetical protein [Pseudomonadota bacterium]
MDLIEEAGSPFTSDVFNGSRTRSFKGTLYFLNTREACLDFDLALVPGTAPYFEAVLQCKIDLAVEYFFTLEQALVDADARGNLFSPSLNRLLRDHSRALSMIKTGQWVKGIDRLEDLQTKVLNGDWTVDGRNDPGNVLMRLANLIWRTKQLQIAEAALLAL